MQPPLKAKPLAWRTPLSCIQLNYPGSLAARRGPGDNQPSQVKLQFGAGFVLCSSLTFLGEVGGKTAKPVEFGTKKLHLLAASEASDKEIFYLMNYQSR